LPQPFFSLVGPAARLLLGGTKIANLLVDADQVVVELLESMEL
jgi:hypothetical protein